MNKSPQERIAVAMSGGVDSSVTAAVLVDAGYEVVGLTMQLYDHGELTAKSKTCCAGQDIYDARRVADALGIPHYVLDYESTFQADVIEPFAKSYKNGETPIPCILCNQTVKFRDLISSAKEIGATALATGHYVRRIENENGPGLYRGCDYDRDQSYFLFATTREQLDFLRFPLGDLSKQQTRELAERFALSVANKPDSQDICFVPTGKYTDVVQKYGGDDFKRGKIVHVDGREIGRHDGIENFTIGQRRGLGIGGEREPLYVVNVNPQTNTVTAGPRSALGRERISLRNLNWLGEGEAPDANGEKVFARVRNAHIPVPATVYSGGENGGPTVCFEEPLYGVSPGQACVFYREDRVLGGGWIARDHVIDSLPHNLRAGEHAPA